MAKYPRYVVIKYADASSELTVFDRESGRRIENITSMTLTWTANARVPIGTMTLETAKGHEYTEQVVPITVSQNFD